MTVWRLQANNQVTLQQIFGIIQLESVQEPYLDFRFPKSENAEV